MSDTKRFVTEAIRKVLFWAQSLTKLMKMDLLTTSRWKDHVFDHSVGFTAKPLTNFEDSPSDNRYSQYLKPPFKINIMSANNAPKLTIEEQLTMGLSSVKIPEVPAASIKMYPYTPTPIGLGIELNTQVPHQVWVTTSGDSFQFNERKNKYGLMLATSIVEEVRKTFDAKREKVKANEKSGNMDLKKEACRVGERDSCDRVFLAEGQRLSSLGNFAPEKITTRQLKLCWHVMCGFNVSGNGFNLKLEEILLDFCRIRLGICPSETDEFTAAISAVQKAFLRTTKDTKQTGNGIWTLPLVHLLNGHLHARRMTTLAINADATKDEDMEVFRANHTKSIWISVMKNNHAEIKEIKVESRPLVREQLTSFLVSHDPDAQVPNELPEPQEQDEDDNKHDRPSKKRRTLNFRVDS